MELKRNKNGSLVGVNGGIERVAAHLYRVKSNSDEAIVYDTYVESISKKQARCSCRFFVVNGTLCKHGEGAIDFERFVKNSDPEQYRQELKDRKERREAGVRKRPYRGSRQDEVRT